jgi:nucleotide-binding universal stress UspA family protein
MSKSEDKGPRARRLRGVLLASEGREIGPDTLRAAMLLAQPDNAKVNVLVISRIWGTGLGLPHPGLLPSKQEVASARDKVAEAIDYLERRGVHATGEVIGTRRPAKVIVREALKRECDVIVMGADPRGRISDFNWTNEPYRVARKAPMSVQLVKRQVLPEKQAWP